MPESPTPTPVPPAAGEGKKRDMKEVQFATGRVVIIEGIYFKIVNIQPKEQILMVQVMKQEEIDQAYAAARARQAAAGTAPGDACKICAGVGYLEIQTEGPNKGKIVSCDCKKTPKIGTARTATTPGTEGNAAVTTEVKLESKGTGGGKCEPCGGTGKISGISSFFKKKDCLDCEGTGKVAS